jgi:hypothetical protein
MGSGFRRNDELIGSGFRRNDELIGSGVLRNDEIMRFITFMLPTSELVGCMCAEQKLELQPQRMITTDSFPVVIVVLNPEL